MRDDTGEAGNAPEHEERGMYESSRSDADGVLVRVGSPSRLISG